MKKKVMTYDILIPKLSDEIIDCQISRWMKNVSDYVKEGEVLVELETEKTTVEIESPTEGILEYIYVFEGEEVIDGERIGVINTDLSLDSGDDDIIDLDEDEEESEDELNDELEEGEDEIDDEFDFDDEEEIEEGVYVDSDDDHYN
jgi:pyruvate/2-oxoglutarate dehydrogenase complex dihydrolipoamide acyltransferase (E2) component